MRLHHPRKFGWAAILVAGIQLACGGEAGPPAPGSIALSSDVITFHAIGETEQLVATVSDDNGNPLPDATVTWTSTDQAVATVSNTGLVTAQGSGETQVTAAAGEVTAIAEVSVMPTPAEIRRIAGNAQTGIVGQPLPQALVVQVEDALDHPISGVNVAFAVTQGGGSVQPATAQTDAEGRASAIFTLGSTAGAPQQVTATVTGTSLNTAFTATAVDPTPGITAAAGNGQSAPAGQPVPVPPAVRILDALGGPIPDIAVSFQVTGGGGNVTGGETITDANGIATVGSWTIGAGGVNTLTAAAAQPGLDGNPVTFVATTDASTGFNIKTRFLGSPSAAQLIAFAQAELRWEQLISGDLADVAIQVPSTDCTPAVDETVDDVVIFATLQPIDGPGAVLGAAGPCYIRTTGGLTIIGRMFFDVADLELIENNDLLDEVITHEMGHVLGYGTLWEDQELLVDKKLTDPPGVDPHFIGTQAIAEFNAAGGNTYTGQKVPVEDCGPESPCSDMSGEGTADSHWRETVFGNELMTGFVDLGVNPLSRISVASLADLGYTVNLGAADPFTLAPGIRIAGSRRMLHLKNDIIRGPIRQVDASGRVVGVLSR